MNEPIKTNEFIKICDRAGVVVGGTTYHVLKMYWEEKDAQIAVKDAEIESLAKAVATYTRESVDHKCKIVDLAAENERLKKTSPETYTYDGKNVFDWCKTAYSLTNQLHNVGSESPSMNQVLKDKINELTAENRELVAYLPKRVKVFEDRIKEREATVSVMKSFLSQAAEDLCSEFCGGTHTHSCTQRVKILSTPTTNLLKKWEGMERVVEAAKQVARREELTGPVSELIEALKDLEGAGK